MHRSMGWRVLQEAFRVSAGNRLGNQDHHRVYRIRKRYGRDCEIVCDREDTRRTILDGIARKEAYLSTPRPKLLTECTACPYRKGCVTDYVCQTTSAENAVSIFSCGKLLSAHRARNVPVEELMGKSVTRPMTHRTILNTSCLPGETARQGTDWLWSAAWAVSPRKRI